MKLDAQFDLDRCKVSPLCMWKARKICRPCSKRVTCFDTHIVGYVYVHVYDVDATGQRRLQDIVAERWLRMAGHIISMPPGRPANHAMPWTRRGSGRRRGRPTKTWRSTFKEDLVDRGVDWNSVRAVATNRSMQMANSCCPLSCQGLDCAVFNVPSNTV